MNEREWREFFGLPDNITTAQGSENRFLIIFYTILTVLFLDLFYFLNIGAQIETLTWAIIPFIYTIGIVPLGIGCIKINRLFNSPFPHWKYQSVITGLMSILFIYLSITISYSKKIKFLWIHSVIYIIGFVLVISAMVYRYIKLKKYPRKKEKKKNATWIYASSIPLMLILTFFLRKAAKKIETQLLYQILSIGCVLVGFIFLVISFITIQNIYFAKKYKVFGD